MRTTRCIVAALSLLCATSSLSAQTNADVIVGDLFDVQLWGNENGIYAYSVGTESCNVGDTLLNWVQATPAHPVIGQEMWRIRDGVLEQVGISWLKHSFCALSLSECDPCQLGTGCEALGIGCSDPYGTGLNGEQGNLGPRSQVNAHTGVFPFPYSAPPALTVIDKRLQVHEDDLDPALNAGAIYLVTSHYVTNDDALAGNGNNNSSYREVVIDPVTYVASLAPGSATERESPGIQAWQDFVPTVQLEDVQVPNDGLFIVGHNVTDNGNGTWHYEYAVYNMNSDRCANAFEVQFPGNVTVTNIGFHDVDHHSGEPYVGTDWAGTYTPGTGVTWQTESFAANQDANAIRWSTMYNFRFDCNAPPGPGTGFLGLFKPGTPFSMNLNLSVPTGSNVPPITGFSCVPGANDVALSWTNGDVYDSIELSRDGQLIATLAGTDTSYSDPGLAPDTYTWTLQGIQGTESTLTTNCTGIVTLRILSIADDLGFAGQSALEIPLLSSHSQPLEGFTASIQIPSDRLTVVDVTINGTPTASNGAEFVELNSGADFVTANVVLDAVGPFAGQTIPTGTEVEVLRMIFSVALGVTDGETREISFVDGLGSPAIDNTVRINGVDQIPTTVNGTITFASQPTFIRGDCNGDDLVGIADAISGLLWLFAGGLAPDCEKSCDTNDDGMVQIVDMINLLSYLFVANQTPPAAPFPGAGVDPTPDGLTCQ